MIARACNTTSQIDWRECLQSVREIAKFTVTQPHKAPPEATNLSTKVAFELNLHGLVQCASVVHNHKIEVEEPAPAPAAAPVPKADPAAAPKTVDAEMADANAPPAEAPATAEGGADGAADAPMDTSAGAENGDASNVEAPPAVAEPEPPKMVKKTKKVRSL